MKTLKLRFNTENEGSLFWRVIIDGSEFLADNVKIKTPSSTSCDKLPDGRIKYHITCEYNKLIWEGTNLIIK